MTNDYENTWQGREYTVEELCDTVFYLARYAECLEIDKVITVPDERELSWMIQDWARQFEQSFDPDSGKDYQSELESQGTRWLLDTFPYDPEMDCADMAPEPENTPDSNMAGAGFLGMQSL